MGKILTALSLLTIFTFAFGIDKECARQQYLLAIENQDYEKPIKGCLFEANCKHYTNLLYRSK